MTDEWDLEEDDSSEVKKDSRRVDASEKVQLLGYKEAEASDEVDLRGSESSEFSDDRKSSQEIGRTVCNSVYYELILSSSNSYFTTEVHR